jgi:hypothetical protein
MADNDKVDNMFDEIIRTEFKENGEVKVELVSPSAEEMEFAVADFVRSFKDFKRVNRPDGFMSNEWWRCLEWLALADSQMKDQFCGRDRSPQSIAAYHKYRMKLSGGQSYRADA